MDVFGVRGMVSIGKRIRKTEGAGSTHGMGEETARGIMRREESGGDTKKGGKIAYLCGKRERAVRGGGRECW